MENFTSLMDNAHKDDIIFTVIQIFKHLEEKRPLPGEIRPKIINAQTIKQAEAIIKLTTDLFDIPNMKEFGLSNLFIDLHYTNINVDMTVFLLGMVKEFITLRHNEAEAIRQRFDITHCRNTLLTVTQHMKQEYFFKGKIVNSKLTREYCEELLNKLNVPLSSCLAPEHTTRHFFKRVVRQEIFC